MLTNVKANKLTISKQSELYKNNKNYHYWCRLCPQLKDSFQSMQKHRRIMHGIIGRTTSIKHTQLEPDIHDPNYFCQSCEKTFATRKKYRTHLKGCHYIVLKHRPDSNVVPDPDNPDFYCCSCQHAYTCWASYRIHLNTIHNIKVRPRRSPKNPAILPDWNDPNFHCASCNIDYLSKKRYHLHCVGVHNMERPKKTVDPAELPDLHDPNFFCKMCKKSYTSERLFRSHCYNMHRMRPTIDAGSRMSRDREVTCCACNHSFKQRTD